MSAVKAYQAVLKFVKIPKEATYAAALLDIY